MGEALLAKETLALPEIVELLGQRPYPMKESILEYLQELRERKVQEEENKPEEQKDAQASSTSTESSETPKEPESTTQKDEQQKNQ